MRWGEGAVMEIKIGSKVAVKKYLHLGKNYGGMVFKPEHRSLANTTLTVDDIENGKVWIKGVKFSKVMLVLLDAPEAPETPEAPEAPSRETLYKVGDEVKVKSGLFRTNGGIGVNKEMVILSRERAVLTIKEVITKFDDIRYRVVENHHIWNDEMLEPLSKELGTLNVGDTVQVVNVDGIGNLVVAELLKNALGKIVALSTYSGKYLVEFECFDWVEELHMGGDS